ncbi:Retrovirus-related Pol polyprotein from transposon TNT 1-94 [Cucumis melo var. makuwa]|uniref:Retrovirus-related Pol polyprotein from transposon TNT 1-94 n=1 Tax=Cucumis melo var. makuwa TaxID=1194695 RepID=A0A5A7UDR4_CUCMM|nr:Retrovirus-related Pol polyprotein from transposon TNT 1-94 [Cucumis melo var. makuwa]
MNDNEVWDLVKLSKESKRVGCKWVFKAKRDSNGNIERYKARLVAKGYTQKDGIDYKETLSPVSKKDSLRIIMALVAHYDLELHQMDVKTAFLNGNLDEEVFMDQPEGFMVEEKEHTMCKLKRSIYGLKQASRQWYQSNLGMDHWKAAKKVLRYLQGTKDYMLTYKRSDHLKISSPSRRCRLSLVSRRAAVAEPCTSVSLRRPFLCLISLRLEVVVGRPPFVTVRRTYLYPKTRADPRRGSHPPDCFALTAARKVVDCWSLPTLGQRRVVVRPSAQSVAHSRIRKADPHVCALLHEPIRLQPFRASRSPRASIAA